MYLFFHKQQCWWEQYHIHWMNVILRLFYVNLAVMIRSEIGFHSMRLLTAPFEGSSPTQSVCGSSSLRLPE